jgi:site-specific DNA recombinase
MGHTNVMRWNEPDRWVQSDVPAHPAIIDPDMFEQAQALLARRGDRLGGPRQQYRSRHPYLFKGVVYCRVCKRKMQGQHSHGVAYYRCRFPQEYALANAIDHPRNVIMREDVMVGPLDARLASAFDPVGRRRTIHALADVSHVDDGPDPRVAAARAVIQSCDAKLNRYRMALDAGADPAVVAAWIKATQAERARAEQDLRGHTAAPRSAMTVEQVTELVDSLGDLTVAMREASPEDKAEVYRQFGLRLTFHPDKQMAHAQVDSGMRRWETVRVEGGTLAPTHSIPA